MSQNADVRTRDLAVLCPSPLSSHAPPRALCPPPLPSTRTCARTLRCAHVPFIHCHANTRARTHTHTQTHLISPSYTQSLVLGRDHGFRQQAADRLRRLRPLRQPLLDGGRIQVGLLAQRVVVAQALCARGVERERERAKSDERLTGWGWNGDACPTEDSTTPAASQRYSLQHGRRPGSPKPGSAGLTHALSAARE